MKQVNAVFTLILAVIIPLATFLIELVSGICASTIFDPMASALMIPAIASVPVIAALGLWKRVKGLDWLTEEMLSFLYLWNVVIAGYFCLVWGPVLGFAVIAVIYFGLGFLVLAPLLSFVFALVGGIRACRRSSSENRKWYPLAGVLAGVVFLILAEGPSWYTITEIRRVAKQADKENVLVAARNVEKFGSAETCIRLATRTGSPPAAVIGGWMSNRWEIQNREAKAAARMFYHITGASAYDATPHMRRTVDVFSQWDPNVGGDEVAKVIRDLRLQSSYVSGKIETDSGLAYQEWTMEIRNDTKSQQEGRFNVLLPQGSVVSRLTLWVNGEPREAAFAAKNKVAAAYKSIVRQKRDPVLVRWVAPDRIYVQCFPVPQNGGVMKFRIGYICPVAGAMTAPLIADSNFEIPETFHHTVRLHSDGAVSDPGTGLEVVDHPQKGQVLMGELGHKRFSSPAPMGRLILPEENANTVWTEDPMATEGEGRFLVRYSGKIEEPEEEAPPTVVVVDSSRAMEPFHKDVVKLAEVLGGRNVSWFVAGREGVTAIPGGDVASHIEDMRFRGGVDNSDAMAEAIQSIPEKEVCRLIWLHGDQPVETDPNTTAAVKQALKKRHLLEVHCLSAHVGTNFLLRALSEAPQLRTATRAVNLVEQVAELIEGEDRKTHRWERVKSEAQIPAGAVEVSDILARRWAFETSMARHRTGKWNKEDTALAARYQLVTPFSGAVVLETAQQYKDNDLKPVDPDLTPSVSTVPEPEFYLLLLVALLVLMGMKFNRRVRCA